MRLVAVLLLVAIALPAAVIPGNATSGEKVFREQRCVSCHSIQGKGGDAAPDLARAPIGRYTPALLAATIWNHAPQMWSAMDAAGIERPNLTAGEAADLFAYFYAFRYFEQPGDAGRGKRILEQKGCTGCHGAGAAPPVEEWEAFSDPIQLARSMWNHAPKMNDLGGFRPLSAQEMTDLVVYIQNLPGASRSTRRFALASAETGARLFELKGCAGCHTGDNALTGKLQGRSHAALAAAMWNHAPIMRPAAKELLPEEMSRLVGYLWSIQYFDPIGDPAKGSRVAEQKRCVSCHGSSAPAFASLAGKLDSIEFVSATWRHGPTMLENMRKSNIPWPRFEGDELSDLLAYINGL